MLTKKCFKCKKIKPIDNFYKHSEMADGYLGKCKKCTKGDVTKNYHKNIDYYKKYDEKRQQDPSRRARKIGYMQKLRLRSPGKYKAKMKLGNAVRDGRIIKKPCEVCGNPKSEAHHKDYRKYLDVQWLCFKHHRELHKNIK
jgi:hypothetical protein